MKSSPTLTTLFNLFLFPSRQYVWVEKFRTTDAIWLLWFAQWSKVYNSLCDLPARVSHRNFSLPPQTHICMYEQLPQGSMCVVPHALCWEVTQVQFPVLLKSHLSALTFVTHILLITCDTFIFFKIKCVQWI